MPEAQLILKARAVLGEGPLWDVRTQSLYWVDIIGESLHRYHPQKHEDEVWSIGQAVGTVVVRASGGLLLAVRHGFAFFDPAQNLLMPVHDPEQDRPANRFNDGKCDPAGRFWAGTMADGMASGAGALYRLDPDLSVHRMLENVTCSNGLVWSADLSTMYYIDSPTRVVQAFDYDFNSGAITNGRTAIEFPTDIGVPDGMAIDAAGKLWVAHYGSGQVIRWDPDTGRRLQRINVAAKNVTACAFGGPDMKTLYITTAHRSEADATDYDGGLFVYEADVAGMPSYEFAG